MTDANVPRTTGEMIARAITGRANRGAFGVMVRDMPEFEPEAIVSGLSDVRSRVRLAMPGYAPTHAKALREVARRAGFEDRAFVTTIEGAERWRNDPAVTETIVVVAPREIPKLHSLNRFETLSGEELYRQICREATDALGVNEAQRQLWRAFQQREVMKLVGLEGLLAYFSALRACKNNEIPLRSRDLLYVMGFLPDPDLFTAPTAAKIAHRLKENQRVVDALEVLSRTDRQRISKSLAGRAGKKSNEALQVIYQRVMSFHRAQDPALLAQLTLRDVHRLLSAKPEPTEQEEAGGVDVGAGTEDESRPIVRALDLLLEGDEAGLGQLVDAVQACVEAEDADADEMEDRDPKTGVQLDIKRTHPFLRVVERYVGPDKWGGVVTTPASTIDEALALLDKAEFRPFDPGEAGWRVRETLVEIVTEAELDVPLVETFDQLRAARTRLAAEVRTLLLHPESIFARSRFEEAERYLGAYERLIEGLKQSYQAIAAVAPMGVEILCSQVLALDSIVFATTAGFKAILSPLHPLHLWKFLELARQIRAQAATLSNAEKDLLRERVDDLPNFVTTLYLSNFITDSGPRVLPEAGVKGGIPFFEELAQQYAGRDGIAELTRLFEKFCSLYPHARMGLRLVLIDPPDLDYILKELVRMSERTPDLDGLHVRVFFTRPHSAAVAALGGGAEDEEGAERFRGVGSSSRFTLEVHDEVIKGGVVAELLEKHPAHVAVFFDPSTAKADRFPRAPSLSVHPLCLPMQFSYDRITKMVRVVPAADGGLFADHNDLRDRLSHQLTGSFFGVTAELQSKHRDLARLGQGCTWFVIADRAQEGVLSFGVPRVSLQRCGKRDVAVYATGLQKFVAEFDRQIRRCNYTPSARAVETLINDLGMLLSDGLIALVSKGGGGPLDERRTRGLLGTLVTSAWYRGRHPRSLVVSIDSPEARRWLELNEDASRADLFGIVDEPDGTVIVDLIEVKTYEQPELAYKIAGGEISGAAVSQLLNTARIVDEIFRFDPARPRLVAPQRREVMRQQLFRECFFEGRTEQDKQYWSKRLNEIFGLEAKVKLRLSLVLVGLTQAHAPTERRFSAGGREINLVELTEDEVRRHVSDPVSSRPPPPRRPDDGGGAPPTNGAPPSTPPAPPEPSPASGGTDRDAAATEAQSTISEQSVVGDEERALIARHATDLKRILRDHGIPVQELDPEKAQIGPSVLRFRVRLKAGAKVATLRSRAEDIGRELASRTTPLIDNIAGENYVSVDLERPRRQVLPLLPAIGALPDPRGLMLPVAAGVTPGGENVQLDLVQLPHLLVAGSTMSGKTVFLHAILLSLIAKLSPSRLELLIIDPKATDFVLYNGLPYLRGGRVFTEAEDAIEQLQALTGEELRERTRVLQQARCPNLAEYNAANPRAALKPIVVVIDEYADLIAVLSKKDRAEFEREINRLAQRARSVGIHLVLATQRPTTDVVTGMLKANMPCRISFRLPQRIDSQTILDQSGAENLFGRGDMLLLQNDRVSRLQGYYLPPTEAAEFLSGRFPGSGSAPVDLDDDALDLSIDDSDRANTEPLVGEATGLAASGTDDLLGGDVMTVEVETKAGEGAEVIGQSGDVLKQSVLATWRHVQQHAAEYGIPKKRLAGTGVSVHLVNIAEYREGPSAGIPFVVAIVSALTQRPVRPGLAMTGEVSLKGKVGSVGGIAQKVVAAYKRGRKLVIIPKANAADVGSIPDAVRQAIDIRVVENVREVIEIALA